MHKDEMQKKKKNMLRNVRRICAYMLLAALPLTACAPAAQKTGVQVVSTLFPTYDFARQLAGENAAVTLLLPPGVESHSYEPSPADVVAVHKADVFIYTGSAMEPWADKLIADLPQSVQVVDASKGLTLDANAEEGAEEGEEAHAGESEHAGHVHQYDPHIWTDPVMAQTMVKNIAEGLCAADPSHAEAYAQNAAAYTEKLAALDKAFADMVSSSKRSEIVFGGRFALHYFAKRYGLTCVAAYDSCSAETEPSARAVAQIIDRIRTDGVPVIYYEELVDPQVARAIAEETGAQMLLLHSCHNVSASELKDGATYLALMEQNLENLRIGLN